MKVLIIGGGKFGFRLAEYLTRKNHEIVVVDNDPETFHALGAEFTGRTICGVGYDKAVLEQGLSARTVELDKEDRKLVADLNLLTDKPVLYVCNVDEKSAATGNAYTEAVREAIAGERAEMLVIAAATEADIAELEDFDERQMFLEDLGLEESGVARLIKSAYKLLNLETFFTHGAAQPRP